MNLRWLLGNFTDRQYKLSRRDQHRLSMAAHKKYLSWRRFWGYSLVVIAVPIGLAYRFGIPAALDWLGLTGQTSAHTWAFAVVSLLVWPYSAWAYRTLYINRSAGRCAIMGTICASFAATNCADWGTRWNGALNVDRGARQCRSNTREPTPSVAWHPGRLRVDWEWADGILGSRLNSCGQEGGSSCNHLR